MNRIDDITLSDYGIVINKFINYVTLCEFDVKISRFLEKFI